MAIRRNGFHAEAGDTFHANAIGVVVTFLGDFGGNLFERREKDALCLDRCNSGLDSFCGVEGTEPFSPPGVTDSANVERDGFMPGD